MSRPATAAMLAAGEAAYLEWVLQPGPIPHSRPELFRRVWEAMDAAAAPPCRVVRPDLLRRFQRVLQEQADFDLSAWNPVERAKPWRELALGEDIGLDTLRQLELLMAIDEAFGVPIEAAEYRRCATLGAIADLLAAKVPPP